MKRKWSVLSLLMLVLILVPAMPVLADEGQPANQPELQTPSDPDNSAARRPFFGLEGVIVGDPEHPVITVRITRWHGGPPAPSNPLAVVVNDATRYYQVGSDGEMHEITFDDLADGQTVFITGRVVGNTYLARRVVVRQPRPRPFSLTGIIVGDPVYPTFNVQVTRWHGSAAPSAEPLVVTVDENTRYHRAGPDGMEEIGFEDLADGQTVLVAGRVLVEDGTITYLARRVVVRQPRPQPFSAQGTVTAVDLTNQTLTMDVIRGQGAAKGHDTLTVAWNDDTRFARREPDGMNPIEPDEIMEGDRVRVVGTYFEDVFTARAVVVLLPKPDTFWAAGQITGVGTDSAFTMYVVVGKRAAEDLTGQELTVVVTEETELFERTAEGLNPITFEDLAVGNLVHTGGHVLEDVFTARRVVQFPLP